MAITNRNFILHQYDEIDRQVTWLTLSVDLATWRAPLSDRFDEAERAIAAAASSRTRRDV